MVMNLTLVAGPVALSTTHSSQAAMVEGMGAMEVEGTLRRTAEEEEEEVTDPLVATSSSRHPLPCTWLLLNGYSD